jgi:protein-S-isoprenylcysteine O-methyltransferase Ste14
MSGLENRIPPPLVAAAFALAMWGASRGLPDLSAQFPGQRLAAASALAAGLAVIISAVAQFVRSRTTVDPLHPAAASKLVTGGVFRLTRNPMYLGMALILGAWALWLGNGMAAVLPLGFVAWITRFQIAPEERALRANFGDEFENYAQRVRRWL